MDVSQGTPGVVQGQEVVQPPVVPTPIQEPTTPTTQEVPPIVVNEPPVTPAEPTNEDTSNKDADVQEQVYEYPTMDNPDAQSIVDVFKEKAVSLDTMNSIFEKVMQTGDVTDIDKVALDKAVGTTAANLIMIAATRAASDAEQKRNAAKTEVFTAVGGEQAWAAITGWAKSKEASDSAFSEVLNTYRSMIDAGGEQRRLAVRALKEAYMQDPSTTITPNLLSGDSEAVVSGSPITSKADYVTELRAAFKERNEAKIADIQRRWKIANPN